MSEISTSEHHAIAHARVKVADATDDNPECCFDYELVEALLRVIDRHIILPDLTGGVSQPEVLTSDPVAWQYQAKIGWGDVWRTTDADPSAPGFFATPDLWTVRPLYLRAAQASTYRADAIEECARHLEREADVATNSLHCGDNSGTIAAVHRVSRVYYEAAKSLRAIKNDGIRTEASPVPSAHCEGGK